MSRTSGRPLLSGALRGLQLCDLVVENNAQRGDRPVPGRELLVQDAMRLTVRLDLPQHDRVLPALLRLPQQLGQVHAWAWHGLARLSVLPGRNLWLAISHGLGALLGLYRRVLRLRQRLCDLLP